MIKTTVYMSEEMDSTLDAKAAVSGTSKAELIRRGIAMLLESCTPSRDLPPLPIFDSGRSRTAHEMDHAIADQIGERSMRR